MARQVDVVSEKLTSDQDFLNENEDSNESEEVPDDEIDDNGLTNPGWADSISRILKTNIPKSKKSIVLSKAKKLTDLKKDKVKAAGFQVQTADGEIKDEKIEVETNDLVVTGEPPRKKKRPLVDLRIKPNILEKDRERTFQKIATKGVVQLFNAVKLQQKQISDKLKEAGPLEVRKEKVLKNIDKRAFLDVLMGEKSQKIDNISIDKTETDRDEKGNEISNSAWSVLRDDFMMSAKMKDWDKDLGAVDDILL